jgi:GWxTD domain-containing protein
MGVTRTVRLLESGLAHAPVLIGFLKPVILLPAGLAAGLRTAQVEAILLHELAHVRRHDYLVNLLQTAVEGLLFYHPGVWWVSRVARRERENCCDDAVIALNGDAVLYAETLAALEVLRGVEPALAATGGDLASRVRRLLRPSEAAHVPAGGIVTAAALVLGGAAVLAGWQQAPAQQPPRPVPQVQVAPPRVQRKQPQVAEQITRTVPNPYQKWLQEDVAYIITDEERAAYGRLEARADLESFIEQFWLRRDPTPGTPFNEFKQEHYRRIAYTNESFADPDLAGWKTDRGRIYIVYGPPDEKQTHPSGDAGNPPNPPWEEWHYKNVQGIGELRLTFIDAQRDGRYRLQDPGSPVIRRVLKVDASVPEPYRRWLEQDAAYIIHADEHGQFEKLATDAEREKFILDFWEKRGVDYKEEHYRRLAWANEHFAEGDTPGWMSARGRRYIVGGPPDAIIKRAAQGNKKPSEGWVYKDKDSGRVVIWKFEVRDRQGTPQALAPSLDLRMRGRFANPSTNRTFYFASAVIYIPRNGVPQPNGDELYQSPVHDTAVRVTPSGSVSITNPIQEGSLATIVLSPVMHTTGPVEVFRDSLVKGPWYEKTVILKPGTYRVEVTMYKDGEPLPLRDYVDFQVKAPAR